MVRNGIITKFEEREPTPLVNRLGRSLDSLLRPTFKYPHFASTMGTTPVNLFENEGDMVFSLDGCVEIFGILTESQPLFMFPIQIQPHAVWAEDFTRHLSDQNRPNNWRVRRSGRKCRGHEVFREPSGSMTAICMVQTWNWTLKNALWSWRKSEFMVWTVGKVGSKQNLGTEVNVGSNKPPRTSNLLRCDTTWAPSSHITWAPSSHIL